MANSIMLAVALAHVEFAALFLEQGGHGGHALFGVGGYPSTILRMVPLPIALRWGGNQEAGCFLILQLGECTNFL